MSELSSNFCILPPIAAFQLLVTITWNSGCNTNTRMMKRGASHMKVRQIMSHNVVCVEPTLPIAKVAQKMRELDVGFLPICENDRLIGTITDRDITIRSVAQGLDPRLIHIREIMSQSVFYCFDDEDVEQAGKAMQENEVRRILVLDRQKRLVGVVSIGDIARTTGESGLAGETLGEIAEAA